MSPPRSAADASTNGSETVPNASPDASPDRLATVVEAAEILGITPDAVRSRLRRGTLKRSPERGEEGEVLVVLSARSADQSETVYDQSSDASGDQSATDRDASRGAPVDGALVERMASEIDHLRNELALERESSSELRRIIAALTQRVPVVELEAPPEPSGGPQTASEEPVKGDTPEPVERPQKRSWWRSFFGFE